MSWRSPAFALVALAVVAGFGLAGCGLQPLYGSGTTTASGTRLAEVMASVDVKPIPGRVGQKLRNELIFSNTGGNYAPETRYKLQIAIRERVIDQLVQISGDARGQVYQLEASFKLVDAKNGKVIHSGAAISRAAYNRYQEIFANVRARRDAENRAARTIAESIKTQLAAYLATSA
jgi:LPS-assembly lipoprotein